MALSPGQHRLGPGRGRIVLHTFRDGLAARAGHDLTIDVASWEGELTVSEESAPARLDVRIDLTSLAVREGTGGLSALTARDRRDIAGTARKVLATDRHPDARFRAELFEARPGGGVITGTLTLHGQTHPLRLEVREVTEGRYHATGSVTQSDFGIKPYTGFLGALRVRDAVDIDIEVGLADPDATAGPP
jgi:polyisoprenoid-binding protein YceI